MSGIEEKVEDLLLDLWSKDIFELLRGGQEEAATSVMKAMGMSESDAKKTVREYKDMIAAKAEGKGASA